MHEYLIPASVQLSSLAPTNPQSVVGFIPLGFFQLDDNRGSNYQSRELKTVYLDVICQTFKI